MSPLDLSKIAEGSSSLIPAGNLAQPLASFDLDGVAVGQCVGELGTDSDSDSSSSSRPHSAGISPKGARKVLDSLPEQKNEPAGKALSRPERKSDSLRKPEPTQKASWVEISKDNREPDQGSEGDSCLNPTMRIPANEVDDLGLGVRFGRIKAIKNNS